MGLSTRGRVLKRNGSVKAWTFEERQANPRTLVARHSRLVLVLTAAPDQFISQQQGRQTAGERGGESEKVPVPTLSNNLFAAETAVVSSSSHHAQRDGEDWVDDFLDKSVWASRALPFELSAAVTFKGSFAGEEQLIYWVIDIACSSCADAWARRDIQHVPAAAPVGQFAHRYSMRSVWLARPIRVIGGISFNGASAAVRRAGARHRSRPAIRAGCVRSPAQLRVTFFCLSAG